MQPYMKSTQLFVCPSDSGPRFNLPAPYGSLRRSYAIAAYARETVFNPGRNTGMGGASIALFPATALTILGGEVNMCPANTTTIEEYRGCSTFNNMDQIRPVTSDTWLWQTPVGTGASHLDSTNLLYMDGHVKSYIARRGALRPLDGHPFGNFTANSGGSWLTFNKGDNGGLPDNPQ